MAGERELDVGHTKAGARIGYLLYMILLLVNP